MAEIKKESGVERFIKEGFSFADVKKEVNASSIAVSQKVNSNVSKISDKIDMSLVKIKTEPDCDIAPAPINFMHHQEVNPFETITAIKEEINNDTDVVNNNNLTVHLLIPDTNFDENVGDIHANSEDSDMPSMQSVLTETRKNSLQSNINSDLVPKNTSRRSTSESTNKQSEKRKCTTDCINLESFAPSSSTKKLGEIIVEPCEPVKKYRGKKGPINQEISDKIPNEVSVIKLKSSVPQTSTTGMNEINISQPKKRGRKKGSQNKEKKTKIKEKVVCPFCDSTVVKTYFPYHARVHTDEKPYKCPKCPYKSHFKRPLDVHMESHHPTQGYIKPIE